MSILSDFGFYAILTNPVVGYERLTRVLVDHGVAFVQLRMKDCTTDEIMPIAEKLRAITTGTSTRFIVNDDPHLAVTIGADGVHLGQEDMPYAQARAIVGPGAIVGISTHTPEQTRAACAAGADYVGVGPVFATPTKRKPDPVIGIDGMKKMLALATVPAVAIGGINLDNLQEVLEAGARNFCMVRQLTLSPEPQEVLHRMRTIAKQYVNFYRDNCCM